MTIRTATPYLILNGAAEKAIAFYREALGARATTLQRFGDVDGSCPEARRNLVMHAELKLGNTLLMLSDGPGEGALVRGGPVSVALDLDDVAETRRSFEALARGGTVIEPLFQAPWGALFGVVHDAFGISWMFNCATKP
jgi:PhnB protein